MKNFEKFGLSSEEKINVVGGAAKKFMTESSLNTTSGILDFAFVDPTGDIDDVAEVHDGGGDFKVVETTRGGKNKYTSKSTGKFSR